MRKKAVELPGVTLGEGMPKVCVPVMGADARALRAAADAARAQADLIELRLDSVSPEMDAACLRAACRTVREAAQGTAILATMRTARDGGAGDADAARYEALLVMLARERLCDALDVELSIGEAAFSRIARTAACAQADDALTQPIIAISLGERGMSTRICAEAMGSCLSFGTAGAASAPGQMEAGALREALALVHRALAREAQEF